MIDLADTASGQTLIAIGAVPQTLTFDVGADDGPSANLELDGSVDATLVTGLTMTESGKPVYFVVDGDDLVLGVTVTDVANVGDGISQGEIENVVFSMHLSTTDPTAGVFVGLSKSPDGWRVVSVSVKRLPEPQPPNEG